MNNTNPSPPTISLTPSSLEVGTQNQGNRSRSRAGTLPSTFLNTGLPFGLPPATADATSPLMSSIGGSAIGGSAIGGSAGSNIPNIAGPGDEFGATGGRRLRSGSLFSTNSIWNDDNVSLHSSGFMDSNGTPNSFVSPTLGAQPSSLNLNNTNNDPIEHDTSNLIINRNRSYTTNAALPSDLASNGVNRLSTSPFLNTLSHNELLETFVNPGTTSPGTARLRAQTFSGVHPPTIQEDFRSQQPQNLYQNVYNPTAATAKPVLLDDFDLTSMVITNNFENANLGPTNYLLFDNIPVFFDANRLYTVLTSSRQSNIILSVRTSTTPNSKLALVECATIEIAMNLKATFNHFEIVPGIILYIAFAKCQDNLSPSHEPAEPVAPVAESNRTSPTNLKEVKDTLLHTITLLSGDSKSIDMKKIVSIINKSLSYPPESYQDNFGPLPEPIPIRQFDAPKLRDLRKDLEYNELIMKTPNAAKLDHGDNNYMSQLELEELCLAMLDELPELCYDYIGNTIVQKLFLLVKSPLIKLIMVKEITPYLTQLSIHKNGTWAIQKIINLCDYDSHYQEKYLIGASLKPYSVKLFNDQFGNYVLQGCIKFGSPFNDFIFESILDNFLEISFGRFGARSIRTILETSNNKFITKEQILLVSGLIVEHANDLAVNNNGSLLITWFLDTFNGAGSRFDKKYELLTNKLIKNLRFLCTHKVANLTILKILNNRQDLRLKQLVMDEIFGRFDDDDQTINPPSKLLEAILAENPDNNAGPLFIYKILANPLLLTLNEGEKHSSKNSRYQKFIIQQIRRLLLELSITNFQPYKKLMDEVGLSNTKVNRSNSFSKRTNGSGKRNINLRTNPLQQQQPQQQQYGMSYPPISYQSYPPMMTPQAMMNYQYQQPGFQQQTSAAQQQEYAVMQQLEQLSLSSAALGYSNPGTPNDVSQNQKNLFF